MTWNGIEPVVKMLDGEYKTGITVQKKEMEIYNSVIDRYSGLEKYFVEIASSRTSVLG